MTLFGPQIQRVVGIYNGHLLSIEQFGRGVSRGTFLILYQNSTKT